MRIFITLLLCTICASAFSATLKGSAESYAGQQIDLLVYNDLFTKEQIRIDKQVLSNAGVFSFKLDLKEARIIVLKMGDYQSTFYAIPGADYDVTISEFDPRTAPPLAELKYLPVEFNTQDDYKINTLIQKINVEVEKFETKNYLAFLQNKAKPLVETFEKKMEQNEKYNQLDFTKNYYRYSIARLKSLARYSEKELHTSYLKGKPIYYQNPAYVEFVNTFYNKWFKRYELQSNYYNMLASIQIKPNLDSLYFFLSKNEFMKNQDILEVVTIKELHREGVENKKYEGKNIIKLLRDIDRSTTSKTNRSIAHFYLRELVRLAVGNPAPNINIKEINGVDFDLKKYRGKYVYLDFWATWCKPCIRSMTLINSMYPKYKDKVEFVSISVDAKRKRYDKFVDRMNYPWTFVYGGGNQKLKQDYDVFAMPLYYLIDPEGVLIQSPAFSPGHGIEQSFERLFNTKKSDKPEVWDWKNGPKKENGKKD